ncbi:GDSL-type esterase/lipase family protein [bacterium]|nr:GDSL-type esterase/lipase family protein [bacterium]
MNRIKIRYLCYLALMLVSSVESRASIKVACVGDSITQGWELGQFTYPMKLGQMLGGKYEVKNFGVSGRTLLKKGDYPYTNEDTYKKTLDWEPDIVIIKLGTNDSKPQNWSPYGKHFESDYKSLIESYQNLPSKPRILLATPCPIFSRVFGPDCPEVVAKKIAPAVRSLAQSFGLELIEIHERMLGLSELLPDSVHPDMYGTTAMAAIVYEKIIRFKTGLIRPTITIKRPLRNRKIEIEWPAIYGGYVLEEGSVPLRSKNKEIIWKVCKWAGRLEGDVFRMPFTAKRGKSSFFRLMRP